MRIIQNHDEVKVTTMAHITELQWLEMRNKRQTIKKLNKEEYVIMATGEMKEFQTKSETRADNINSLGKTMRRLRNLIRANFSGGQNELMLTLTYAENMTDEKRLLDDLKKFYKKLKYHHGSFEYLTVIEPQGRGAWHAHILVKFPAPIVLDNNSKTWKYWGHGFTRTKRLVEVDDIGAYLTAYLTDIPLEDARKLPVGTISGEIVEKVHADGKTKKYVKGGRVSLYPANMRIYRPSEGIIKPESELMTYENAKKKHSLEEATFRSEHSFKLDDEKNQTVIYEQYNSKRK